MSPNIEVEPEIEQMDEGIGARMENCIRILRVMRLKTFSARLFLNRVIDHVDDIDFNNQLTDYVLRFNHAGDYGDYTAIEDVFWDMIHDQHPRLPIDRLDQELMASYRFD